MSEIWVAAGLLAAAYYFTRVKQTDRRVELPPADEPQVLVGENVVRSNPLPQSPTGSTNVKFRRAAVVTGDDGSAKVSLT
jgi:hypothetical protein